MPPRVLSRYQQASSIKRRAPALYAVGVLAEMGHQLRDLGNLGAHADDAAVTTQDVPVIEDFAEAITEYVYRAPEKLRAAKASLDERKAASA